MWRSVCPLPLQRTMKMRTSLMMRKSLLSLSFPNSHHSHLSVSFLPFSSLISLSPSLNHNLILGNPARSFFSFSQSPSSSPSPSPPSDPSPSFPPPPLLSISPSSLSSLSLHSSLSFPFFPNSLQSENDKILFLSPKEISKVTQNTIVECKLIIQYFKAQCEKYNTNNDNGNDNDKGQSKTVLPSPPLSLSLSLFPSPPSPSPSPSSLVFLLDSVSDRLCRLSDIFQFLRSSHHDVSTRILCDSQLNILLSEMEILNRDSSLSICVKNLLSFFPPNSPSHRALFMFYKDFTTRVCAKDKEKGIQMAQEKLFEKEGKLINIQQNVTRERENSIGGKEPMQWVKIKFKSPSSYQSLITQLNPSQKDRCKWISADLTVEIPSPLPLEIFFSLIKCAPNEDLRREISLYPLQSPPSFPALCDLLMEILILRDEISTSYGFSSWSEMTLENSMAKKENHIKTLLKNNFTKKRKGKGKEQGHQREENPQTQTPYPSHNVLFDHQQSINSISSPLSPSSHTEYFSLSNALSGLSLLVSHLFDCHLLRVPLSPSDHWYQNHRENKNDFPCELIKCFLIEKKSQKVISLIYLDLFERAGKQATNATFSLRGARDIRGTEEKTDYPNGDGRQIPIVVINTNLQKHKGNRSDNPLLSFSSLELLFHEFGHSLHHSFSHSPYQHLSGARNEMDFVEIPSQIMENFLFHYEFIELFCKNEKGNPIDKETLDSLNKISQLNSQFSAQNQNIWAYFDLVIHGKEFQNFRKEKRALGFSSVEIFHSMFLNIYNEFQSLSASQASPLPPPSFLFFRFFEFPHLLHYASSYYSYSYCKIWADIIWDKIFTLPCPSESANSDVKLLNYSGGKILREELFQWGTQKDSMEMIANIMGMTTEEVRNISGGREKEVKVQI